MHFERPNEEKVCKEQVNRLSELYKEFGHLFNSKTRMLEMNDTQFSHLFQQMAKIAPSGLDMVMTEDIPSNVNRMEPSSSEWIDYQTGLCKQLWTFPGSLYFCFTIISTIGYGNIAPVTREGRIFFMFYSIPGIGLFGILIGRFQQVIKHVVDAGEEKFNMKSDKNWIYWILVLIVLLLMFWIFPSVLIYVATKLDLLEAVYFCIGTFI